MFFILNKQKIYAYVVSIITVILLFCVTGSLNMQKESVQTSSQNEKLLPIYNVQTDENKVAFTMNCAW